MPARPSRLRRKKKRSTIAYLGMVSLMDMFTIILIFLLHTFSAEGEAVTSTKDFRLPVSTSVAEYRSRLTVMVTSRSIMVEGVKVVDLKDLSTDELLIEPLFKVLTEEAKKSLFIAGINPELALNREVIIQGDRKISFELLQRVMFTCGQVGYNNIALAVVSSGK